MDEAIWFWIGIISVIIGLSVLAQVAMDASEQNRGRTIESSLEQLGAQCDFVCREERGTRLGVRVAIPTGAVMSAQDETICIEHDGETSCTPCNCALEEGVALNLTAPEARFFPSTHLYECRFHHVPPVNLTCSG